MDVPYMVHCYSGDPSHIMEVIPGTELEAKCIARVERGLMDALPLDYDACPSCVEDRREKLRQDRDMMSLVGCPAADIESNCEDSCPCKSMEVIPDSIYEDQVRGLMPQYA